jgi:DNA-binding MarR family transcriptional regulator
MKKKNYRVTLTDPDTGEIVSEKIEEITVLDKDDLVRKELMKQPFAKMYLNAIGSITNLTGKEIKVLLHLAEVMDYNNRVIFPTVNRKVFADKNEISISSVNNALSSLHKEGFIKRTMQNVYFINPTIVGKGDINNNIKIVMEFNSEDGLNIKFYNNDK